MPVAELNLSTSLERYLRYVSIERGLSVHTVAAYRRDLAVYLSFLHDRGVESPSAVSGVDVAAFARHLSTRQESPLGASSVSRMLSSVRTFHRYLLGEGQVEVDVASDTTPPKLPSRLPKAISVEQMAQVLAATDGDEPQALRDKALLELLYATGARISEAVALNVDDVIDAEVVRLFGKGGKQRIVPLGSYAR
ncbi:MAG: site-specific tyrosine recombinase XerD, partial [Glaciihabitans sp.]|nr:site-specific tyrosine recombinase XerD [Glaciihabitans sp.]